MLFPFLEVVAEVCHQAALRAGNVEGVCAADAGVVVAVEDVVGVDLQLQFGREAVCRHGVECGVAACAQGKNILISMDIAVPDAKNAELICSNWKNASNDIYQYTMKKLFEKGD